MTPRWKWLGGTISMAGFTLIVTALALYGFVEMSS